MKVKSQKFSDLDIGGREACKHNFEISDIGGSLFISRLLNFTRNCKILSQTIDALR